jgi:hypothetical protein
VRHDHVKALAARTDVEPGTDVRLEYRFFDEKNPALLGTPGEQMLGSLENEIPAQMGEDDEIGGEFGYSHSDRYVARGIPVIRV